ncbi:MAG: GAF domain-containing protein [Candidatus Gastranaerophilales bacterium]|nr:GAF domain-containing protein [Candidatus Gastranaerophilales bacterium]
MAWLKDKESRFVLVNEFFAKVCGQSVENIIGKNDYDYWSAEIADTYRKSDIEVMQTRRQKSLEEIIITPEGVKWHETFKSPVFDLKGNVVGTVGFARDITERKESEKKLSELLATTKELADREALLRKITETIRNSLDIEKVKNNLVREVGKTFHADRCFIRLYGPDNFCYPIDAEYLSSPDLKSSQNREYSDEFNKYVRSYLSSKIMIIQDAQDMINDPDVHPTFKEFLIDLDIKSSCAMPIYIDHDLIGVFVAQYTRKKVYMDEDFIGLLKTISTQAGIALHQAKLYNTVAKIAEQERLLKEVFYVCKSNLEIDEILNVIFKKMSSLFGAQRITLVDVKGLYGEGELFYEFTESPDVKRLGDIDKNDWDTLCEYWKTQLHAGVQQVVINNIAKYDGFPYEVKKVFESLDIKSLVGFLMKTSENTLGVLFLYVYHTPKFWTEAEIGAIQTIKEHISIMMWEKKLYNKEQFLTNISHELKTPVAIINSYTEALINRDTHKSEMSEKFLKVIKSNIDRITNIIDDLLYLTSFENDAKNENIDFSLEELGCIAESAIELCRVQAGFKNINIHYECEKPVYANVNSLLIQQALVNLINNAVKYSGENSEIHISVTSRDKDALISVKDNGIGIPESEFKNIFQRFYCIDRSHSRETGGSGLGLSIVEKVVEIHDGHIELNSKVGEGSNFTICLPLASKES